MPITPYLDDHQFDPETKRVMGLSFEMACIDLRLTDLDNLIKQIEPLRACRRPLGLSNPAIAARSSIAYEHPSASPGRTLPMGSRNRPVLNHSTHPRVANPTAANG